MTKQKIWIYLVSAALLAFVVWLCAEQTDQMRGIPLSVSVTADGHTEEIRPWRAEDGTYYVFLPSYARMDRVQICLNTEKEVYLNGERVQNGMSCAEFSLDEPYGVSGVIRGKEYRWQIMFLQSANVAAMYVDTQSGSMDYIHEKKGNEESGNVRLYLADGGLNHSGELDSIQGRGNNTWAAFEKKPYSICLADEADLLGMGAAKNWVLLANADDTSNMRNKIVYDFAKVIGLEYSPDARWVDLYLNGEYVGLYLLSERNEIHSERVDISGQGSFLVSLENENRMIRQGYPYISTQSGKHLRVHACDEFTESVMAKLAVRWQAIENAVLSGDGVDPETGKTLDALIDIDSWAKKYLIEEIFGNIDAGNHSQFFYYDGSSCEDRVYSGPVWDYDHALGNPNEWQLSAPNGLFADRYIIEDGFAPSWNHYLYRKEPFRQEVTAQYREQMLPALAELIESRVDNYVQQIEKSVRLDCLRWGNIGNDFLCEVQYLKDYLQERIAFLNRLWIDGDVYHLVRAEKWEWGYYGYYAVFDGEKLLDIPTFEDTEYSHFVGWYYKDTGEPFDMTQPITEDIEIYAKWEDTASNRWDNVVKLIPLGVIAVIGAALLWVEYRRARKSR